MDFGYLHYDQSPIFDQWVLVMSNSGFIKLPRSLFDDPHWKSFSLEERSIFLAIVSNACWEETKQDDFGVICILKPGQLLMTQRKLIEKSFPETQNPILLNQYKSSVVRALAKFKKLNFSYHETYQRKTLHTILRKDILENLVPNIEPKSYQTRTIKEEVNNLRNKQHIFTSDSVEYGLCEFFLSLILSKKPDFKKPNLQSWAKHIDLMIRIDKRDPEDIRMLMQWINNDEFEFPNVLSTSKLRNRFDPLQIKSKSKKINFKSSQEENKNIAEDTSKTHFSKYCELKVNGVDVIFIPTAGVDTTPITLKYSENGFKEQLESNLKKRGFIRKVKLEI